ncbi:MAG TPA: DMT family transporter, partial [Planctomycetota bacterium]|nr:DMT family transporter [Planctomycetota bacterium]
VERRRSGPGTPDGRDVLLLLGTGLFFAGDLAFWHLSILRTRIANATLLACLASTLAALAAWILFRERLRGWVLSGLLLALGGAGLLMKGSASGSGDLGGDALGVLAAVFYAGYLLGIGRLRARVTTAGSMAWSGVGASAGLLLAAAWAGERLLPGTSRGWLWVGLLALGGQILGQTLIAYALAHLSMAFSAVSLLVQPVVAAVLSWRFYGESLSTLQLGGGALILAGIVAARLGSLSKE